MENIRQDIKDGTLKRVYLLFGTEDYLIRQYKNMLYAAAGQDSMNCMKADGKDISLGAVTDFALTMPFFAKYRTVLLSDTGLFSAASEGWSELIESLPDTAVVIFAEQKVDKRNKLYKTVQKVGYACELNTPDERTLKKWIGGILKKEGLGISESVCEEFLLRTGQDMENIKNQLEKLISYCRGSAGVTYDDVNAVCSVVPQSQVFKMIEAAAEGRTQEALAYYYDLLALREPSMRILYLIGRHINQLLITRRMISEGQGQSSVASELGIMPFAAGKLMRQARSYTQDELLGLLKMCVANEEAVKTGNMDEKIAVETALIKCSDR